MQQPPPDVMTQNLNQAIRAEVAALLSYLRAGADPTWNAPSKCKGWAAKDVVAHLVIGGRFFSQACHAAVEGTPPPPFDRAKLDADRAALAGQPREQLLDELGELAAELTAYTDGLSAEDAARTVALPFGTVAVWTIVGVRLNEVALHSWDIRAAQDTNAVVSPEAVPPLVTMALGRLATLGRGEKTDGTWQLDIDGPSGGPVAVRVQGDQVSVERGPAANPDARLVLDGDAFLRLAWGRPTSPRPSRRARCGSRGIAAARWRCSGCSAASDGRGMTAVEAPAAAAAGPAAPPAPPADRGPARRLFRAVLPANGLYAWAAALGIQVSVPAIVARFGPSDVFLVPMAVASVGGWARGRRPLLPATSLDRLLLVLLAVYALATAIAFVTLGSVPFWTWFNKDLGLLVLIATFYLLVAHVTTAETWRRLVDTWLLGGSLLNGVALAVTMVCWLTGAANPFTYLGRLHGLLINANAYGLFITLLLALQLSLLLARRPPTARRWRGLGVLNAALLVVGVLLTASRASWLACLVGVGCVVLCLRPRAVGYLAVALVLGGAAAGLLLWASGLDQVIFRLWPHLSFTDDRTMIHALAWEWFTASPLTLLFGIGLGTFLTNSGAFLPWPLQIHNTYLWVLVEMGLLGFVVVLGLLGRVGLRAWQAMRTRRDVEPRTVGVLAALAALLVWSLVHEGLYQRTLWLLFALVETAPVLERGNRSCPPLL